MLKITKYEFKDNQTLPRKEQEWEQVDTNPTSIASILITIDNMKKNEYLLIEKI